MVHAYYLEVVVTNLLDMVPKTIMLFMVYHTTGPKYQLVSSEPYTRSKRLKQHLSDKLQARAADLMVEAEDVKTQRENANNAIAVSFHNCTTIPETTGI